MQQFLYRPNRQGDQSRSGAQGDALLRPLLGTINVIFAAPGRTGSRPSRVMSVARLSVEDTNSKPKRAKVEVRSSLRRVMVDQGSCVEITYPDLYRGLNLKPKDLTVYDSPLVSFDGKVVISKGQIRLPVQVGSETVEGDFIVVDAYSPYTAIMPRP